MRVCQNRHIRNQRDGSTDHFDQWNRPQCFFVDEEDYDETFDINGDGKINGSDIQEIINIILEEE